MLLPSMLVLLNVFPLCRHFKTRFPAANVPRLNDKVATNTFFSDVPAHDDGIMGHGGANMAQLYTRVATGFTQCDKALKARDNPTYNKHRVAKGVIKSPCNELLLKVLQNVDLLEL